ncbi:MAG: hypothetical protein WC413_03895 [Candidatus Nanoarchaeia archaeon]
MKKLKKPIKLEDLYYNTKGPIKTITFNTFKTVTFGKLKSAITGKEITLRKKKK